MKGHKFIRADGMRWARLGKGRKKLQRWRKAEGMHSKIRRRRKGYPSKPLVGFAAPRKNVGKLNGLYPILVHNVPEMEKVHKATQIAIVARVGAKKKMEMLKKAQEHGIQVFNAGGEQLRQRINERSATTGGVASKK